MDEKSHLHLFIKIIHKIDKILKIGRIINLQKKNMNNKITYKMNKNKNFLKIQNFNNKNIKKNHHINLNTQINHNKNEYHYKKYQYHLNNNKIIIYYNE